MLTYDGHKKWNGFIKMICYKKNSEETNLIEKALGVLQLVQVDSLL